MKSIDYYYLISELRSYDDLEANWDGENADKPKKTSLNLCVNYLTKHKDILIDIPDTMLHTDGTVSLFWNSIDGYYKEIHFIDESNIPAILLDKINRIKYNITFDSNFNIVKYSQH